MSGFFWKSKKRGRSEQGADQAQGQGGAPSEAEDEARFADTAELDRVSYGDEGEAADDLADGDDEKTQISPNQRRPSLPNQPLSGRAPSPVSALGDVEDDDEKTALSAPMRSARQMRLATSERQGPTARADSLYSRLVATSPEPCAPDCLDQRDGSEDDEKARQIQPSAPNFERDLHRLGAPIESRAAARDAAADPADDFQDWLGATPAPEAATGRRSAVPHLDDGGEAVAPMPALPLQRQDAATAEEDDGALIDEALDEDIAELSPAPEGDVEPGDAELQARARAIELLILDVDGVLTDGGLYYGAQGEVLKRFHVQDGHGIALAQKAGLKIAILTARTSQIVEYRAKELGIAPVFQGRKDKIAGLEALLAEVHLGADQVAYMGDDLNDLGVLTRVQLSACPADACPEVRARAAIAVSSSGGSGAVRELIEFILKAQGKWNAIVQRALADGQRMG